MKCGTVSESYKQTDGQCVVTCSQLCILISSSDLLSLSARQLLRLPPVLLTRGITAHRWRCAEQSGSGCTGASLLSFEANKTLADTCVHPRLLIWVWTDSTYLSKDSRVNTNHLRINYIYNRCFSRITPLDTKHLISKHITPTISIERQKPSRTTGSSVQSSQTCH